MNNTIDAAANAPILRELPIGHEDPESQFWIKPEHRDHFQRVQPPKRVVEQAELDAAKQERYDEDLKVWQRVHDRKASGDPSSYRAWLRANTREDGSPNLSTVGLMDGAKVRDPFDNSPSSEYAQLAFFRACRSEAASVYNQEQADAKR